MYSKNLLSDYNNKVFSVSKSKESSPISPERHTSFNLINHFVGVAYPPNKISKTILKMQAFYTCF